MEGWAQQARALVRRPDEGCRLTQLRQLARQSSGGAQNPRLQAVPVFRRLDLMPEELEPFVGLEIVGTVCLRPARPVGGRVATLRPGTRSEQCRDLSLHGRLATSVECPSEPLGQRCRHGVVVVDWQFCIIPSAAIVRWSSLGRVSIACSRGWASVRAASAIAP